MSLIVLKDIYKIYHVGGEEVRALDGVDLTIEAVSYTHLTLPTKA